MATVEREYLREFLRRRRLNDPSLTESDLVREVLHNALVAHGVIPDHSLALETLPTDASPPVQRPRLPPEEVNRLLRETFGTDFGGPLGPSSKDDEQAPER
jgi:hypothetical protein